MVGQVRPRRAGHVRELGGVAGTVEELDQHPPPGRIRECSADSRQHFEIDQRPYSHGLTIQLYLYCIVDGTVIACQA